MDALQIAVYAFALTGGATPLSCAEKDAVVVCDNGRQATLNAAGNIEFDDRVEARALVDGRLVFSNGLYTYWGSAGWVQFSNGVGVRKMTDGAFRFSTGYECRPAGKDKARCTKRP
jgi:hypothetical protein